MSEQTKPEDGTTGTTVTVETKPEEPKKLDITQEQLDAIIADRVKRAQPKDYAELVALRERVTAEADAKKDELQREKDARAEEAKKAAAKSAMADQRLRRAAILTEAVAANAADADIVVALLMGSEDIAVTDEGEVTGAKAAVAKLLKDKPLLGKPATAANGGEFGGTDHKTLDEKISAAEAAGDFKTATALKVQKGLNAT